MIFISLSHPIALGLSLIIHTLLVRAATGLAGGHYWFSYILFLVFLGGVLVLFIYITSLASNEKFSVGWGTIIAVSGLVMAVLLGGCLTILPAPETTSIAPTWGLFGLWPESLGTLVVKLYSTGCYKVTALLVFYLLYALLVCANIVNKYTGALRNFN